MTNTLTFREGAYKMYVLDSESLWVWDRRDRKKRIIQNTDNPFAVLDYIKDKVTKERYFEVEKLLFENL